MVYLQGAGQFYALSQHLEVKQLLVDGRAVSALNRYRLHSPQGKELELDVAEFLKFDEFDKLVASNIYFDTIVSKNLSKELNNKNLASNLLFISKLKTRPD